MSQGHISSWPQKELPPEVGTDFLELEGMSRGLGLLGGPVDRVQAQMTSEGLCHPRVLSVCPSFWNTGANPYSDEFMV